MHNTCWIQTVPGNFWFPRTPMPALVDIKTIAEVLARLPRFYGHTQPGRNLSVAAHSIHVCELVHDPALKLPALLHDAHEAYTGVGDVPTPIKHILNINVSDDPEHSQWCPLTEFEWAIDWAVASHFGFERDLFHHDLIKAADRRMIITERHWYMAPCPHPWEGDWADPLPEAPDNFEGHAAEKFLEVFRSLVEAAP